MEKDIKVIDPYMAWAPKAEGIKWHLPYESPVKVVGFAWFDKNHSYQRLPTPDPNSTVTQFPNGVRTTIPVAGCGAYYMMLQTAGGQVRFRTDSSSFSVQATLHETYGMDHMAFSGSAGFDLYLNCDGTWKCFGVTRWDHSKLSFASTIVFGVERKMRDVIINFPLYNGVDALEIGLDEDAKVEPATPFPSPKPIVWYGTSILQGGCACRPGMASTNIISRMVDREIINLGFSGNGKGEPEIANLMAEIDAGAFLIDYAWNVDELALEATLPGVLDIIRGKHPNTPIVLVGPTPGVCALPELHSDIIAHKTDIMRKEWIKRTKAGDGNISFFDTLNEKALGSDFWECAVDGVHLTDLGFYRFSQAICPLIKEVLGKNA